ncbi:MAG: hypothetical protein GEV11_21160 [Streptosporangiales bacterium]|nr:hypothetical protein [Streptosporangiales bacterium]
MFLDKLMLLLHIGFAIFTIGPLTVATSLTPRYIRNKDVAVLRFLQRITRIYGAGTALVFLAGLVLARDKFDQFWLSASMTLFIVAVLLLFGLVVRDQKKAIDTLTNEESEDDARVQTGRIAGVSGAIAIIWLVILTFMIWQPGA